MQEAEKIWMNGGLVDWADAHVHVLSHGLHYGTTVFEGIRSYDANGGTAVLQLDDHLLRLERSAAMYHMPLPYTRAEMRLAVHHDDLGERVRRLHIRPIVLRGYGTMGLFPLEAPVDVAVAAWSGARTWARTGCGRASGRRSRAGGSSAPTATTPSSTCTRAERHVRHPANRPSGSPSPRAPASRRSPGMPSSVAGRWS